MLSPALVVSSVQAPGKQRALFMQVYDRVTPKTEKVLGATRAAIHNVTVSEDPVMKCARAHCCVLCHLLRDAELGCLGLQSLWCLSKLLF